MNYKTRTPINPRLTPAKPVKANNKNHIRIVLLTVSLFIAAAIAVFALDNESDAYIIDDGYIGLAPEYEDAPHNYSEPTGDDNHFVAAPLYTSGSEDAIMHVTVDYGGNVTLYPHTEVFGVSRTLYEDRAYIHVHIPVEFDAEEISVAKPYGWTYEINHEEVSYEAEEYNYYGYDAHSFESFDLGRTGYEIEETDPVTYTVVSFGYIGIMPLTMPPEVILPFPITIHDVSHGGTGAGGLRTAAGGSATRAIRLTDNITMDGAVITLAGEVHIFSYTGNINTAYRITRIDGEDRHFNITGATHIWNATIDRPPGPMMTCPHTGVDHITPGGPAGRGGGIDITAATGHLHLENGSTISHNRITTGGSGLGRGGGVRVVTGQFTMQEGATISFNAASGASSGGGGGIHFQGSAAAANSVGRMYGGLIYRNHSTSVGGGVQLTATTPTGTARFYMTGGAVKYNVSGTSGGGLQTNSDGTFILDGTLIIHGNRALGTLGTQGGGGIRLYGTNTTINLSPGSQITNNHANNNGGGISLRVASQGIRAIDVNFDGNTTYGAGGAIHANVALSGGNAGSPTTRRAIVIEGESTFRNNRATEGGAIFLPASNLPGTAASTVLVLGEEVIFEDNFATTGMRVCENLEWRNRANVHPDLPSNTGGLQSASLTWVGVNPNVTTPSTTQNPVVELRRHVFNNYDVSPAGNWNYLREIQYSMIGSSTVGNTMTARLTHLHRPRSITVGSGAFTLIPATLQTVFPGRLVLVGHITTPATGAPVTAAGASTTQIEYEITNRLPDPPAVPGAPPPTPPPSPIYTRVTNWYLNNPITHTTLGRTPARSSDVLLAADRLVGRPTGVPNASIPATIQNPAAPIADHNFIPIPDIVQPRIDYYHLVTFTVGVGGGLDADNSTYAAGFVRHGMNIGDAPAISIPNTDVAFGFTGPNWAENASAISVPPTNATVIDGSTNFVITFGGLPDWVRLNNVINNHPNSPATIIIHPAGGAFVNDTFVLATSTFNLVITDPNEMASYEGRTITTLPLPITTGDPSGPPAAHPHRIRIPRAVTIQAAPGSEIILRMPVEDSPNTANEAPWNVGIVEDLNRHFIIESGGNLQLGAPGSGTLTLDGNAVIGGTAQPGTRGGVHITNSHMVMEAGSVIRNNRGSAGGGGVFMSNVAGNAGTAGSTLHMRGAAVIEDNFIVDGGGGGITVGANNLVYLYNGIIRNNNSTSNGGGILASGTNGSQIIMRAPSQIYGNRANAGTGGGVVVGNVQNRLTPVRPSQVITQRNPALGETVFTMHGGSIHNNFASLDGGGVRVGIDAYFNMHGGAIDGNWSNRRGGGVEIIEDSTFTWTGGSITNNGRHPVTDVVTTQHGGGLSALGGAQVHISGSAEKLMAHNDSIHQGGGIYLSTTGLSAQNVSMWRTNRETFIDIAAGTNIIIHDNETGEDGGGIFLENNAFEQGAGNLLNFGASLTMNSGIVRNNIAGEYGGGIAVREQSGDPTQVVTLTLMPSSHIYNNEAGDGGGGVAAFERGAIIMNGGTIGHATTALGNTAGFGGGVWISEGATFTMQAGGTQAEPTHGTIVGNTAQRVDGAGGNGGGVHIVGGEMVIYYGWIIDNETTDCATSAASSHRGGGGIFASGSDSSIVMHDGLIGDNTSAKWGGGVLIRNEATFCMNGGSISGNEAAYISAIINGGGGGVWVERDESVFTMTGGEIYNNIAQGAGGGVGTRAIVNMEGGTIRNNFTNYGGGGVWVGSGMNAIVHSQFFMSGGHIYGNRYIPSVPPGNAPSDTPIPRGGGVYVASTTADSTFIMTGGTIGHANPDYGNLAVIGGGVWVGSGGIVYMQPGGTQATPTHGTIEGNRADYGGGIYIGSQFNMYMGTIRNNTADYNGGGVYVPAGMSFNLRSTAAKNITGNDAEYDGGGVWIAQTGQMQMETTTAHPVTSNLSITNNVAGRMGGGIFTMDHIHNNVAYPNPLPVVGPATNTLSHIYQNITLIGVTFAGNTANAMAIPPDNATTANVLPNIT